MSDKKPLRDYKNSRAVLIGTSDYMHLRTVQPAANSLNRMSSLLTSELCGWPKGRVSIIRNEQGPGNLPDRLITLFEGVTDVALFYFVGHGQVDTEDQLCLGLVGSRPEPHRRASTSLQFHAVRRAMLGSPAKTKIIILDCCFAGLANKVTNTLGAVDLLDRTAGTGAYTMAACSSYATAWFEDGPKRSAQTYFTRYLADLIESGIPEEAPALRLRVIFDRLRETLARDDRPVPEDRSIDSAGDFLFAHNAAPSLAYAEDALIETDLLLANQNAIMVNLARRTQALLEQQLSLVDSLEQNEQDTERLTSLYRLDHLATRMRRHSENLLLLAGYEGASRRWSQPVPLADVARAAVSEIEHYDQVVLNIQPGIQVAGWAVSDVVHLVAEIVENGTTFSPEDTQVHLTGRRLASGGVLFDITDNGVGMSEQEMAHANWRLDNQPADEILVSRRMGLFVVGRLAARHGIRVRLEHTQSGGLTALIWLPDNLLLTEASAPAP